MAKNCIAIIPLKSLIKMKVGDKGADFWVVRRGSAAKVGTPTRTWNKEHIGVTVTQTQVLLPDFLFYLLQYLHGQGVWKCASHGTTNLVNIRQTDLGNIPVQISVELDEG